jgi:hypothetical protein
MASAANFSMFGGHVWADSRLNPACWHTVISREPTMFKTIIGEAKWIVGTVSAAPKYVDY